MIKYQLYGRSRLVGLFPGGRFTAESPKLVKSLKHPLIFRRRILLRGVVVLLNSGNYVEQDDRRTKAWVHAISGC